MGFAGGVAAGMRRALEFADDADWIVLLDDDDPPRFPFALERLAAFGAEMRARDPTDRGRGDQRRLVRLAAGTDAPRRRTTDPARMRSPLDHVAGNQLPFFLVGAVRRVGVFCEELFFGFSELEFGLRLWTSGSTLYGYGPLWLESRTQTGRVNLELRPSRRLHPVSWRDYYTLRNAIFILRRFGHPGTALRVTLVHGSGETRRQPPDLPRRGARRISASTSGRSRDGWTDRMGRRVEPDGGRRAGKAQELPRPVGDRRMTATRDRCAGGSVDAERSRWRGMTAKVGVLPTRDPRDAVALAMS